MQVEGALSETENLSTTWSLVSSSKETICAGARIFFFFLVLTFDVSITWSLFTSAAMVGFVFWLLGTWGFREGKKPEMEAANVGERMDSSSPFKAALSTFSANLIEHNPAAMDGNMDDLSWSLMNAHSS